MQSLRQLRGILRGFKLSARSITRPLSTTSRSSSQAQPDIANVALENKKARIQLAGAYRGLEQYGLNEGVDNHLSVMAPAADGSGEIMLLIPYGLHWSEVTASSLIGLNKEGEVVEGNGQCEASAFCIHKAVREKAREKRNHHCVMHLHSTYATSLGCLKDPRLLRIHQSSLLFYNRVAYDTEYEQVGSSLEEGRRLGEKLGDKDVLMMGNHGTLCVGCSVPWAFYRTFFLERVAMLQILAMSSGKEIREIPEQACIKAQQEDFSGEAMEPYVRSLFTSVLRRLHNQHPEFAD